MVAISNPKLTIYGCNLVHLRPDMLAMTRIVLKSCNYDFAVTGRILRKQIFDGCKHIWSLLREIASINGPFWFLRLQPYLVPFLIEIASIFGPYHNIYCNHI